MIKRMNVYDAVLKMTPYFMPKYEGSAFADHSGMNSTITLVAGGAPAVSALNRVAVGSKSPLTCNSTTSYTGNLTKRVGSSYTIMAWVYMPANTAASIMTDATANSGLFYTGASVSLIVPLSDATTALVEYDLPDDRYEPLFVAGTVSPDAISLFIDGVSVDSFEISEGVTVNWKEFTQVRMGLTTSTINYAIDAPAVIPSTLSESDLSFIYKAGRDSVPALDVVGASGGTVWRFIDEERDAEASHQIDWSEGTSVNVSEAEGLLVGGVDVADLTLAGTWTYVIPLADLGLSAFNGLKVEYDTSGSVAAEYSNDDGATWLALPDSRVIATASLLKNILIRLSFTAGMVTPATVSAMSYVLYANYIDHPTGTETRVLTLADAYTTSSEWKEPIDFPSTAGLTTGTAANKKLTVSVASDSSTETFRTMEFWLRPPATSKYVFDMRAASPAYLWVSGAGNGFFAYAGGTLYVNGVSAPTGTLAVDPTKWYHVVMVLSADTNVLINLPHSTASSDMNVGTMALYPSALSAAQIARMYNSYLGKPTASIVESQVVTVAVPLSPAEVTFSDAPWSITSGD